MVATIVSDKSASGSRGACVLLVEDEPELAELLAAQLEEGAYHVDVARNGREALDYLNDATPHLIITDLMMPEMDGHAFLEKLRADDAHAHIPTIVLSSKRKTADVVRSFDLGADDYVTKPIDPAELLARVSTKLGRPTAAKNLLLLDGQSGLLSPQAFAYELGSEMRRAVRVGYPLMVAQMDFAYLEGAAREEAPMLARRIAGILQAQTRPLDRLGRAADGSFLLMMPETVESEAAQRLRWIAMDLAAAMDRQTQFASAAKPAIGYVKARRDEPVEDLLERLGLAFAHASSHPGGPAGWTPWMRRTTGEAKTATPSILLSGLRARVASQLAAQGLPVPWGQSIRRAPDQAHRILLVEDDPDLTEHLRAQLEFVGYRVVHAANGEDAFRALGTMTPDLIVSDVVMPRMDGLDFMRAVRSHPELRHIPAIMLTTRRKVTDILVGLDAGADDYLIKPVVPDELVARIRAKISRPPVPADQIWRDQHSGFLSPRAFMRELDAEMHRGVRAGYPTTAGLIEFAERKALRERLGPGFDAPLARQIAAALSEEIGPLDVCGRAEDGGYLVLMPETTEAEAERRLQRLGEAIVNKRYRVAGEGLNLTPVIGFSGAAPDVDAEELRGRLILAASHAEQYLDLRPSRYVPDMVMSDEPRTLPLRLGLIGERLRLPAQTIATFLMGWVLPFFVYLGMASIGHDVSVAAYYVFVFVLVLTCLLIWGENWAALRPVELPEEPEDHWPPASAIIAAYLPNEAATIVSTLEAMLEIDYPGDLQIILAYNTPKSMPIEKTLREMAEHDPRLEVRRIVGSTSKAQNVNAALSFVKGEFTAVYDADHQPSPDSFRRAWRWLNAGYDVVQGHCLIRNGDASWVARMVAIEFEQIYCVSHPGRARLHRFGIFGGSNGFWRTELLRRTRMRGSMLTEDIDSSLRVVEEGHRIVVDRDLISRELAPTTLKGLMSQRLRWAQGWFQVTNVRLPPALRSPNLSARQKTGMFYLLAWREIFPWVAMQIVPLICFWAYQLGSFAAIDWFVPLFFAITLFVMTTGPFQLMFTYRLAAPEIRARRRWFWFYLFFAVFPYTEFKNILCRVANIKEWMHERAWKITPRD